MNWREIIMDSIVVAIIGLAGAVLSAAVVDSKGYKKIAGKIGNQKSDTLEGQHERIEGLIMTRADVIKETVKERTSNIEKAQDNILTKVYNIDQEMALAKDRYLTLNLDQREIKDSVGKLVNEWEHAIAENKELKSFIMQLEKQIEKMGKQYDEIEAKNKELEKQNKDMSSRYIKAKGMDKEIDM